MVLRSPKLLKHQVCYAKTCIFSPLSAPLLPGDPDSPALLRLGGCMKFTLSGGGAISPDVQVGKSSNCWGISRTQAMEKIHTHRRRRSFSPTHKPNTGYCLVVTGTMEFYDFPHIVKNNPNWRTHIFQRGWNTSQNMFGFLVRNGCGQPLAVRSFKVTVGCLGMRAKA